MSASDSVTPGLYSDAFARQTLLLQRQRKPRLRAALVACEGIADFAVAALGTVVALLLSATKPHSVSEITAFSAVGGILAFFDLRANRAYEGAGGLLQIRETERILATSFRSSLLLSPIVLTLMSGLSKREIVIAPTIIALLLAMKNQCFFLALRAVDRFRNAGERVVVYGTGAAERRLVSVLRASVRLGLKPVAMIDDSEGARDRIVPEYGYRDRSSVPVYAAPINSEMLLTHGCTTLVIMQDGLIAEEIEAATQCARIAGAKVAFASDPGLLEDSDLDCRIVDGLILCSDAKGSEVRVYEATKRMMDVVLSSIAIVALSPVFILIAILIKLDSSGPVLFIQNRIGLNGETFKILKFRSMHEGSGEYEPSPTSSLDPRLTRVGRLLRRLSLDELPQLVNVIRGEMSLVGPRPEMPFVVQRYEPSQRKRLNVMPGITGLWQLSADRAFPIHENLEYDLYYVQNRGLFMDAAILIHTVLFAMRGGI